MMELPKQINNTSERLVDDLKARLSTDSRVSIAAASFSIYALWTISVGAETWQLTKKSCRCSS